MSISETEINEKKHKARAKAAAWAVHSFTTSGIVLGFLGLIAVFEGKQELAFIFMGLLGKSNGLTNVLLSSLWAEIYGVNYLGSIKALTGSLMVFSTALATVVFGILIDLQYSIESIAIFCSIYTAISIIIVLIFQRHYKPVLQNKT